MNFHAYLTDLAARNKMATEQQFHVTTCAGIQALDGVLHNLRNHSRFIAISDVTDGATVQASGGWFARRQVMVFLLARYQPANSADRIEKLNLCRELFRQFKSAFIHDAYRLQPEGVFLNIDRMPSSELATDFLPATTGLYFILSADEPEDLCFNPEEWQTT